MTIVEDLDRARAEFERGDWASALALWAGLEGDDEGGDEGALGPSDLALAAQAAFLLGRRALAIDRYQRAYAAHLATRQPTGALRCAFNLAMLHATAGEQAQSAGWLAKADRLLAELDGREETEVERGYLAFARMFRHIGSGDLATAATLATEAAEAGRSHADADLHALGRSAEGRLAIYAGRIVEGIALLDETMAGLLAGEVSPVIFGHVYCTAIEGCQEVSDIGRVSEWTTGLQGWCSAHPGLVAFTGQCSLHRGQILTAHGAFREAVAEFDRAIERYRTMGSLVAIGQAAYERGQVLRVLGDVAAAERSYQLAAEHGFDPQPGLALLWAGRGEVGAAGAAVRRLLAEAAGPVPRVRVLPGAIDVLVATHDVPLARACSGELEALARDFGIETVLAHAASAAASVELADNDPAAALPYARKARGLWARLDNPYAAGLARVVIGRALAALGDSSSARVELESARTVLAELGAGPDVEQVDRLLGPSVRPRGLTEREVEVLRLVASGRSNAQIAGELFLSERTVARHLSNIFTKLEVGSRTAAAAFAFDHDLV
jgi:DNA-binding CsgD family transcriptional regulator